MPIPIEHRGYSEPHWQEFTWTISGQRVSGVFSELEGSEEEARRVRLAIEIPPDSQNVVISVKKIERKKRDKTGKVGYESEEDYFTISFWSPSLGIGRLIIIPRELVEYQENDRSLFTQIEEVSAYSYDSSNNATYKNLG